ncbi:hypothetical protein F5B22DRAFT_651473 [Xylaria bambusicola]|uniref:uncharacterized protein n=1 Tax=Xylaria bambusicola TaxID=326684 RepID=UPI0020086037|nr:uncharacterized protein F5B22DRAFT_651473 [Xylaria bambusicola]KAI0505674.1 hypothetical protein F5B22DRAFT_651473 [Xylaria bambusicola]
MASDNWKDASDADRQSPNECSPDASSTKPAGSRSKASIRASLACVQCRSKHVKCDARQPACGRCLVEEKPCYYTKSRRGIRDPKKRSLISDQIPVSSPQYNSTAIKCPSKILPFDMPNALSNGWTTSKPADTKRHESLASAFFDYFYPGHPILPPKNYFFGYVESDPNAYHFLLSVIDFCGALHTGDARLNDLREATYAAACGPLPFTVQSVQGLHLLSTIAFGESKLEHHISFGNRSWKMAIELGMHRKAFADRTSDPIWAETYRRTWWYIKFQGMIRRAHETEPAVETYEVESDVDMPYSEEWQYQSGDIPPPISVLQHDREVDLGRSEFPSLALQIELCRIQADLSLLCDEISGGDDENMEKINEADLKICDFLRRIPRWKMEVIDPEGRPDQVLFTTVAWAHISRIRLRQSALRKGLNIREYFPLGPGRGPDRKGQAVKQFGWNPHPVDIQAANSVCDLFRYSIPIKNLRPMMVPGLLRVAIVYLDACVFLGLDSPIFRERINTLIRILTLHGETWSLSRKIAEDIQAVADEYLPLPDNLQGHSTSPDSDEWNALVAEAINNSPFFGPSAVGFDHQSFLNPHLQCVLLNNRESNHHVLAPIVHSFSTGSSAPAT